MKKEQVFLLGASFMALAIAMIGIINIYLSLPDEVFGVLGILTSVAILWIGYNIVDYFHKEPKKQEEWMLISSASEVCGWEVVHEGSFQAVMEYLSIRTKRIVTKRVDHGIVYYGSEPGKMWVVTHRLTLPDGILQIKAWEDWLSSQAENQLP